MSAGTAVAVINYISQIFSPVESLGMEIQTIQSAIAGVRRINEFFELPVLDNNEELQAEKIFDSKDDTLYVQFNDVTFGYEAGHIVIDDKTFVVNRGEQVTLSGRTGAGKSTIFKLLLGLYKPQKGSILINDMNSAAIPDNRKRKYSVMLSSHFIWFREQLKTRLHFMTSPYLTKLLSKRQSLQDFTIQL